MANIFGKNASQPRQRINAVARLTDGFIDFIMYPCPVRDNVAIAFEDFKGEWWTAAEWQHGQFITRESGDNWNEYSLEGSTSDLYEQIKDTLTDFNYHKLQLVANREYTLGPTRAHMTIDELFNPAQYERLRKEWADAFNAVYSAPEGSPKTAFEITLKVARARHQRVCRGVKRRYKKREEVYQDKATRRATESQNSKDLTEDATQE